VKQVDIIRQYLEDFWALAVDVWHRGVFGVDFGEVIVALAIVLLSFWLRGFFRYIAIGRLRALSKRTKNKFDDSMVDAFDEPLRFLPVVFGIFMAAEYLPLEGLAEDIARNGVRSLLIFTIFWVLFNLVTPFGEMLPRFDGAVTRPMIDWGIKAIKAAVVFLGIASILNVWGIEIGPILAGLGLVGVAVALGAQDLFKNLIAGILILAERRFQPGDWIRVDGTVEGTVESIGFRSTRVRRFDMAPVYVPNSALSDTAVTNFSAMTYRRIYWTIGVRYDTSVEQLRKIRDGIENYVTKDDAFVPGTEASTFVRVDKFGESAIDIMLYCFTKTTKWGEWLAIKEALAYHIKDLVEGVGSGFAFPSRSVYVEAPGDDSPEPFVPPDGDPKKGKKPPQGISTDEIQIAEGQA